MTTAVGTLVNDVRYAWRALRARPLASLAAMLTLAIGIGLTAAVFSIVDWVLLRPLPYPAPQELVRIYTAVTTPGKPGAPSNLRYSEFQLLRQVATLRATLAVSPATRIIAGHGFDPAHVIVARMTGDLSGTIGLSPEIGRGFDAQELTGGARVAIVSHAFWRQHLSADAS